MNTDKHIVIEALQLGPTATRPNRPVVWTYRVLTPPTDWRTAAEEWTRLDNLRLDGRIEERRDHFFMVRSNEDPRWAELPRPRVFKKSKSDSLTTKQAKERAARAYAKIDPKGAVRGNTGGWLYREGQSRPLGQGWDVYATQLAKYEKVIRPVPGTKGDWMIVPEYVSLAVKVEI